MSESAEARRADVRAWSLNLMYLEGRQHVRWDRQGDQFATERGGSGKRVTINHLTSIYRNMAARFEAAYPNVVCHPASPSAEDLVKAQMTQAAARHHLRVVKIPRLVSAHVRFLLTCGNAGFHTFYDPGRDVVDTEVTDPFETFFEPGIERESQSEWATIRRWFSKRALQAAYPHLAEEIEKLRTQNPSEQSRQWGRPADQIQGNLARIEVHETYFRGGDHVIAAGELVLWAGPNPFGDDLPIRWVRYTAVSKRFFGLSMLAPLIELQWLYNRRRQQLISNADLMGNPKMLVPRNAGIEAGAFTEKPGEKIFFNASGGRPEPLPASPLPAYVSEEVARVQSEMGDVAGVHGVSLGKRSVGVHSGVAIDALASKDTSHLDGTQEELQHAVEDTVKDALLLMKRHYTEPRWVKMMDNVGAVIWHQLNVTDIQDVPEVFIEAGSLYRDDVLDRDQKAIELFKNGLATPEETRDSLSFHAGDKALEEAADMSHAMDVLQAILSPDFVSGGGTVEIFRTDNLKAFKRVFEDFLRSKSFYGSPPEVQDYVRDVYVAVATGGDPVEAGRNMEGMRIWPLRPAPAPIVAAPDALQPPQPGPPAPDRMPPPSAKPREPKLPGAVDKGMLNEEPLSQMGTRSGGP